MKVIVNIIESERGWGQKLAYTKSFKTVKAARAFAKRFNAKNDKEMVPDWYQYAKIATIDGETVL